MKKLFKEYKPWMQKSHFNYFLLVLLLYGITAALYFITTEFPTNEPVMFDMWIDKQIPLVSYFYFFYFLYYVVPAIILWKLSYYDKKKFFMINIAVYITSIICSISYLFYQVKMNRPDLSMYESFDSVHNLDTFFRFCIANHYNLDHTALDCFPSFHVIIGFAIFVLAFPTWKGERYIPFTMRITCFVFGSGITMAVFFVKQHYFVDAVSAASIYTIVYFATLFVCNKWFKKPFDKIDQLSDISYKEKDPFDPKETKFPYTEYTDQHYLKIKMDRGHVFDENYPYIDKSKSFKFKRFLIHLVLETIVFPFFRIRNGLKIKNKNNFVKHKKELKKGFFTISNHINMWDYIAIMKAIGQRKAHVIVWNKNVNDKDGNLVRLVGGIPIPENSLKASIAYLKAVKELVNEGNYVHIYAEGSMWEYYQPIRPFKHGAMALAKKFDKPVLPMAFSYRKPSWIRKHILRQKCALTLNVGEPLYINKELPESEQERDLLIRLHDKVCELAGIDPKKNLYPPIFENNKRIDYYDLKTK